MDRRENGLKSPSCMAKSMHMYITSEKIGTMFLYLILGDRFKLKNGQVRAKLKWTSYNLHLFHVLKARTCCS